MSQLLAHEKENQKKGRRISITLHLLLLLLAFLYYFETNPTENLENQFAVAVEFVEFKESSLSEYAHSDAGEKRPKTEEVKKVETNPIEEVEVTRPEIELPKTEPVIDPQPTDPIITETFEEESEVIALEEEIELEDPDFEEVPEEPVIEEIPDPVIEKPTKPSKPTKPKNTTPTKPTKPSKPGKPNKGDSDVKPSSIDGSDGGTGKADKGDGDGADKGNDGDSGKGTEGAGTGVYDGSGDGIFGRRVIYRNVKELPLDKTGRIEVKVCVNRAGSVTYLELLEDGTTVTNSKTLKKTLKAAQGYKFEPDFKAASEQCGRLVFKLDLTRINKVHGG